VKFQGESGEVLEVEDTGSVLTAPLDPPFTLQGNPTAGGVANFMISATTGIIPAALGAGSIFFGGVVPIYVTNPVQIKRLRIQWTTIVAFSVPVTRRSLALYRGYGTDTMSNGTRLEPLNKYSSGSNSDLGSAVGGHLWIATTTTLVFAGAEQYEANAFFESPFTNVGNAGNFAERDHDFVEAFGQPITINPGELFAIRNPFVMDAGGTWQIAVEMEWNEAVRPD